MEKWEYSTVKLTAKSIPTGNRKNPTALLWDAEYFAEQLNPYGEQGWELVSIFTTIGGYGTHTTGIYASFKRRK